MKKLNGMYGTTGSYNYSHELVHDRDSTGPGCLLLIQHLGPWAPTLLLTPLYFPGFPSI